MNSSLVLLSAGLDSTVNLYKALRETEVKLCLTFDYGQRAATNEIRQAKKIATDAGVEHKTIKLDWLKDITDTALVDKNVDVPTNMDIDNLEDCSRTAKSVWVPNRNGVMLNIAAAFADALHIDLIIPGFNKEEAATFPDNSTEYLQAATRSLSFSTSQQVQVRCYTSEMDKTQIVSLGRELNAPFSDMWSCYFSGDEPCQSCESCLRFQRAMK